MKFEYIGPNHIEYVDGRMIEGPVNTYGGQNVLNGETIELEGVFAQKALANPNYKQIISVRKQRKLEEIKTEEVTQELEE